MILAIEEAIRNHLVATLPELATAESYAGQFEEEVPKLIPRFPAAFTLYPGSSFERNEYGETTETARFSILVACRDLRGQKQAREGEKGALVLAREVLATLRGEKLGLAIGTFVPRGVSLVYTGGGIVVYGVDLETSFTTP